MASGLDWKDTDGSTDLTDALAGDMARYDGTDWIKVVNLVGGGLTYPDRIVLADAVSWDASATAITLTEAIAARQILSFEMFSSGTTNPDAQGYILSDDLLAKNSYRG